MVVLRLAGPNRGNAPEDRRDCPAGPASCSRRFMTRKLGSAVCTILGSYVPVATASKPGSAAKTSRAGWRIALGDSVRDPAELCRLLGLPPSLAAAAERPASHFGFLVPRGYLARVRPGDPTDPLLLQVLPREAELVRNPTFTPWSGRLSISSCR